MAIEDYGDNARYVFEEALSTYKQKKDKGSFAIIQDLVLDARKIAV